ncbi:MAG: FAD-dependent oxidoreductase [Dehalococcoidia bacterium]
MDRTDRPHVVVVGAGLAGLSAALVAARSGAHVTVLERAGAPGGRATTANEKGFLFNIGPHALYAGAEQMLAELGVAVAGEHPPLGRTVAWRGGKRYRLPLGGASFLATGLLGVRDKLEAGRFFASLGRMDTALLHGVTARDWLATSIHSPRLRQLTEALFRVSSYANGPEVASAGAHLDQLRAASRRPVRYIDGGWQTIVDALRLRVAEAGVTVHTAARVDSVTADAEGWRTRLASGDELRADSVILALGPTEAARLVAGAGGAALARWAGAATPVQAATLDVALSSLPVPKVTYSIGIDRPLYWSVHTAAAQLAPEGGAVIHAATYLPHGEPHDYAAIERELDQLMEALQPGWRNLLVHRRFVPHLMVTNAFVTAAAGGLPGRPRPEVPGAPGLFVAGDWVGPVGMLADSALASGMSAGELAAAVEARGREPAEVT